MPAAARADVWTKSQRLRPRWASGGPLDSVGRGRMSGEVSVVRFILELVIGVVVAAIITAVVMVTMFYFGPWADPPGINELWWLLAATAIVLASWRWWTRLREAP